MLDKLLKESRESVRLMISEPLFKELYDHLKEKKIYIDEFTFKDNIISGEINNGDWKHEHLAAVYAIANFFGDRGVHVEHDQWTTETDGSDCYSAKHIWRLFSKNPDAEPDEPIELELIEPTYVKESNTDTVNNASATTVEDMLAGMIGNCTDAEIDDALKMFTKIAKVLGVSDYTDMQVLVHDGDYNLKSFDTMFTFASDVYKTRDVKLFVIDENGSDAFKAVQEVMAGGTYFIYAKDVLTLDRIIQAVEKYNNGDDEIIDESKSIKESSNSGYWYFTRHGVQPGSIPKGANVLTIQDVENGTYVKLDRVLTTKELNDYEIIEKRPEGLDESKSINEDRQSDILTIKSNIKDNLVLDNYIGTGKSHYQDYQIELFHDSDNYGGYPWCYVISKDSNILTKKCYDEDLSNTLYSIAQFIYNTESKSIKESKDMYCVYFEQDGYEQLEFTGTIDECNKYISDIQAEQDAEFGEEAPERFIKPLGESIESKYIDREVAEKTNSQKIKDAYDQGDLSILVRGDVWYTERCPKGLAKELKAEMKRLYPDLKHLYGESLHVFETTQRQLDGREKILYSRIRKRLGTDDLISTREQWTDAEKQEYSEIRCISMIHSILAYAGEHNYNVEYVMNNRYLKRYIDELGEDRVKVLAAEEIEEFKKATVKFGGTDSEGVSYNQVIFKEPVTEEMTDLVHDEWEQPDVDVAVFVKGEYQIKKLSDDDADKETWEVMHFKGDTNEGTSMGKCDSLSDAKKKADDDAKKSEPKNVTESIDTEYESAIDIFMNTEINDLTIDIVKPAVNYFFDEYKTLPQGMDALDPNFAEQEGEFYNKYYAFAKKCKEVVKSDAFNATGYGSSDALKIKCKELCNKVDWVFPYGWSCHAPKSNKITEEYDPKDTEFNDKYFPRVDLNDDNIHYYKLDGSEYAYDMKNAVVMFLFKDEDEVEHFGIDEAPYRVLDTVGLSRDNWNDRAERDEYLRGYKQDLDDESSYLAQDFIQNELPYYQKQSEEN